MADRGPCAEGSGGTVRRRSSPSESSEVDDTQFVFELVVDETADSFCRRFIAEHLVQLRNYEQASRFGFVMDAWSRESGKATEIRSFIRLNKPFNHIELKYSYLKNARLATANGGYGIRGLTLAWDSAIWGLLREIEFVPFANPFSFPSCDGIAKILFDLEWRPEASDSCKALGRATVAIQYAISLLYGYDRSASMSRYLRRLVNELIDLHDRMRNMSLMSSLRIPGRDLEIVQRLLPERICQQLGIPFSFESCLLDSYYECVEMTMEVIYDQLCYCRECRMRRGERLERLRAQKIGTKYRRRNPDGIRLFEENYVRVAAYPNIGVLRLPKIRHLSDEHQTLVCGHLARDLMYDVHFGSSSPLARVNGIPLPFTAVDCMDIDLGYALYMANNVYFMLFLIRCVRDVVRSEQREYVDLVTGLVREASVMLRRDVDARIRAGADRPVFVASDPRQDGISDEERDLSIANALDRLTFSDERPDGYEDDDNEALERMFIEQRYERMGGFSRDAAKFMDLLDAFRVPKALRENRAREELLLHTFFIKRMYDERPLAGFYGDRLIPYYIFVGGYRRRDGAVIRMGAVTLSDTEIVKGHWRADDLVGMRLRYYDTFEYVDMLRNISVNKQTLMMELDRLYVPKRELDELVISDKDSSGSDEETEDADSGHSEPSDDGGESDGSEFVVERV
ncbi:M27 protein [Murid betaherpesvirus 1]|uniref:M27 protein n=1 Tax=Murid herpesvirus 1 TaxID=10366 RepID=H2A185_MUHV1|nr:M27 protein [Murid betaherpesvirus 1]